VISPEALGALGATPEAARDRFSASYIIAARTIQEVSGLEARARGEHKRLSTLALDSEVRFATADARAAFAEELSDSLARLVAKYHDATTSGGRRFRLVTIAHPVSEPTRDGSTKSTLRRAPSTRGHAGVTKHREKE